MYMEDLGPIWKYKDQQSLISPLVCPMPPGILVSRHTWYPCTVASPMAQQPLHSSDEPSIIPCMSQGCAHNSLMEVGANMSTITAIFA
jgi:hypothetical protein